MSSGGGAVRMRGGNLCPPRSIPNAVCKCGTAGGIERDRHVISHGGCDGFPHWLPLVHQSDSEEKSTRDEGLASGPRPRFRKGFRIFKSRTARHYVEQLQLLRTRASTTAPATWRGGNVVLKLPMARQ
jgi:hypothetical protein